MGEVKSWEMFMTKKAKATVALTGEIVEFDISTPEKMVEVWAMASDYIKAYEYIKESIKKLVPTIVNSSNTFEHNGFMFRISNIQRYTFDKSVMRNVLDEDTFDIFLKPDSTALKKYIKENLEELGDKAGELMHSQIPEGKPYEVIKLEALTSKKRVIK
jgi:hypothetical protein